MKLTVSTILTICHVRSQWCFDLHSSLVPHCSGSYVGISNRKPSLLKYEVYIPSRFIGLVYIPPKNIWYQIYTSKFCQESKQNTYQRQQMASSATYIFGVGFPIHSGKSVTSRLTNKPSSLCTHLFSVHIFHPHPNPEHVY